MNYKGTLFISGFLILFTAISLFGQPREPDPRTGDRRWKQENGVMDGNLVRTRFYNWGEIAYYGKTYSGEWPKGTGHLYIDGVAIFVQAECIDENGDTIHPIEVNYREDTDLHPDNNDAMGWLPLPGYCNYYEESPALSDDPETWPRVWPDKPADWGGYWNGYFGKGIQNADLETYYVMDDDYDIEWNFFPDSMDTTRRGLGMEVAVRGFQWSHILAEDCIFWHFAITNEGTYDYENVLFGFYIDWGVGQSMPSPGGSDDCGSYDTIIDLAYAWSIDNASQWGGKAGVAGFAFLESPGNPWDSFDNDDDGIVDEMRESGPGVYNYSSCGFYDEQGNLDREGGLQYRYHWSGDEDGDWDTFTDKNDNGVWDAGEALNDDLGADGIGPLDEGYFGPDAGEGDGIPTQGEPDFDQTDKDESDQIGLTGFRIFDVHRYPMSDEELIWPILSERRPPTPEQLQGVNLAMYFSSGLFPLHPGETQRFSMALLFGYDEDDLRRNKKTVQSIYNANYNFSRPPDKPKLTVVPGDGKVTLYWDDKAEYSYDRYLQEYDFEGYRIYRSTEPTFLENRIITDAYGNPTFRKPLAQFDLKNDTMPGLYLSGPHLIGVYGAHFDLGDDTGLRHSFVDSTVKNGQTYYYAVVSYDHGYIARDTLGDILFDDEGNPIGIPPTECPSSIIIDEYGEVKADINTAVAVPNAPAAGYNPPHIEGDINHNGVGTGRINVIFLDPGSVKDSSQYQVIFDDTSYLHLDVYPEYTILVDTISQDGFFIPETLMTSNLIGAIDELSLIEYGIVIRVENDTTAKVIDSLTDWIQNQSDCDIEVDYEIMTVPISPTKLDTLSRVFPADILLVFSDTIIGKSTRLLGSYKAISTNFALYNTTADSIKQPFLFANEDKDSLDLFSMRFITTYYGTDSIKTDTTPDVIITLVKDPSSLVNYRTSWQYSISSVPFTPNPSYMVEGSIITDTTYFTPEPGDIFYLQTTHPFRGTWQNDAGDTLSADKFEFTVREESISNDSAKKELDRIAVVPNPYVVAASWEAPNPYQFGRGERKIDFIHLPQKCTIRIFTLRGNLVKTIEHESTIRDGAESWNLVSKEGLDIAYGLYIYHIDAPGIGEKLGKFAIIK